MMKQRSSYLLCAFVFYLAISYCQVDDTLPPLITVTGQGEVKVRPDKVVITVGVEMRDRNLDQARKEADSIAAAVIAYLKGQGVEDKDIQTSYMSVQPDYPYIDWDKVNFNNPVDETQPDYYVAQKSMTFVLRQLNAYDDIMEGLYQAGINNVNDVSFQVEENDSLEDEARKRAAANAINLANELAEELGVRIGKVYSISESTSTSQSNDLDNNEDDDENAANEEENNTESSGPSVAGGRVTVTSNIDVSFYIDQ